MTSENPNNFYPPQLEERRRAANQENSKLLPSPRLRQAGNSLSTLVFYLAILLFIIGFNFSDVMVGNWYQQFLPNLGAKQINDIIFLDSLTGFAVASRNVNPDTASILRTTDGGDSWQIIFTQTPKRFNRIQFINSATGFVCGGTGGGTPQLYKTIDSGQSWSLISTFGCALWKDMYVLDENIIWLVDDNSLCGGVFYTSNGGGSWQQQPAPPANKIYMYNARIGFMSNNSSPNIYNTTNGGVNWNLNLPGEYFTDMHFTDSLTGWKCMPSFDTDSSVKRTTNGGLNWIKQRLPIGGIILTSQIQRFGFINKDTIWGAGGQVFYGGGRFRAMLYRTTNGGNNWLFQVPDTSFGIPALGYLQFLNKNIGWSYNTIRGIHTTNGGDTIFLTGIQQISNNMPKLFQLSQNYPNPFNPKTNIKYQIIPNVKREMSNVKLIVYDLTGKHIIDLVNQKQNAGTYEVDFNGSNYSSGVYFYSLIIDAKVIETRKMILVK